MCPVRVVPGEQPLFPLPDVPHIMDVACFGAVPCGDEELYHNKGIDRLLEEFDGQKAFYSDVTFSREYLYKKYNGAEYDQLKAKLDPDGVLPHLYDKVLAALGCGTHAGARPEKFKLQRLKAAQCSRQDSPEWHILVLQCLPEKLRELKGCMELTAYAKLNPSEFVHFASKSRAHLKQGIITEVSLGYAADPDRHLEDEPLGHAFFSPESVSQGEPVTTAQKRPNEIEVESNKKLKVDPELSQKPPPAEAVPPEEEDHPEDLFDIISSERLRDEERAREAEEKDRYVQEEVGKLTAYKTDLEYLVDAVELVSRKGRFPSAWIPRLERILSSRQMNEFEKEVVILLVGLILLPHRFLQRGAGMYHCRGEPIDVATVLALLSPDLASQIANRKSFYKDSVLVRDHIIHVSTKGVHGDLSSCPVEIDRRMVDFIVGLDSEVHQLVDGSHLYLPQTKMESVVLPEETKTLITKTVQSLSLFKKSKQQFKLDETISSSGLVMLFYGDSGTGKTMTANAIANLLGKKLLLINFPSLGGEQAAGFIRMIFRESKINDAVLFFDECESIFESRDKSNQRDVNMLLTELERHDGMIILATNRPFDLDEAMHRRITLAIDALAMRYELSGGFIKNAILTALSIACRLAMRSFERRIVPRSGLEVLVCGQSLRKKLQEVIDFEKSKTVLYGQWGFGGRTAFSGGQPEIGSCVLFYGPPGTGKSLAAQAIGFEVGRALKVVNSANIVDKLLVRTTKEHPERPRYVGETGKNIEKVFAEARSMEAILVFDEAEGLFGRRNAEAASSVDKHSNLDSGLLLYWLEHYPGLCILTTNARDAIDSAFFRRFRFMVEFPPPDRATRAQLWDASLPKLAPRSSDVDEFEKFSGGDIQNAVIRAASRAALRPEEGGKRFCPIGAVTALGLMQLSVSMSAASRVASFINMQSTCAHMDPYVLILRLPPWSELINTGWPVFGMMYRIAQQLRADGLLEENLDDIFATQLSHGAQERRGAKTFCQLLGYGHGPEESACPLAQAAALLGQAVQGPDAAEAVLRRAQHLVYGLLPRVPGVSECMQAQNLHLGLMLSSHGRMLLEGLYRLQLHLESWFQSPPGDAGPQKICPVGGAQIFFPITIPYTCGRTLAYSIHRVSLQPRPFVVLTEASLPMDLQEELLAEGFRLEFFHAPTLAMKVPSGYEWKLGWFQGRKLTPTMGQLAVWNLTSYDTLVMLDDDMLMIQASDELFSIPVFAMSHDPMPLWSEAMGQSKQSRLNNAARVVHPNKRLFRRMVKQLQINFWGYDLQSLEDTFWGLESSRLGIARFAHSGHFRGCDPRLPGIASRRAQLGLLTGDWPEENKTAPVDPVFAHPMHCVLPADYNFFVDFKSLGAFIVVFFWAARLSGRRQGSKGSKSSTNREL
eukprot:g30852.t1